MGETTISATCWLPECDRPAAPRGTQPRACWAHQPDDAQRYPVIVTYTQEHVVWVEADDAKAAAKRVSNEPWDYTDDNETLVYAVSAVELPKPWEYEYTVYSSGETYSGMECDAHVETYRHHLYEVERAAKKAECAGNGHPGATLERSRVWCPVCWTLPVDALAVRDAR